MLISQYIDLCRRREIGKRVLLVLVAFDMRESGIKGKLSTKGANTLYDIMIWAEIGKRRCLVFKILFDKSVATLFCKQETDHVVRIFHLNPPIVPTRLLDTTKNPLATKPDNTKC